MSEGSGCSASGIEFRGVRKAYGRHLVLRDVDAHIPPGQVTGLLGPNGSGKTTLLRILMGLELPTSGCALIGGRRIVDIAAPLRTVGALLDASWVHPKRTAVDQLRWIAQASGLPTSRVDRALAEAGLQDVADTRVGTFSLGMRQRLGIASTVLGEPEVLIYDEPLNGLDPAGVAWIREFLMGQAARGRTVLLSSHQLSEISLTADRILVLGRGEVMYDGDVADVVRRAGDGIEIEIDDVPAVVTALQETVRRRGWSWQPVASRRASLVTRIGGGTLAEVAALLQQQGATVRRIQEQASLEDAYTQLTEGRVEYVHGPTSSSEGDR